MNIIYERKIDKVKPIDLDKSNGSIFKGFKFWRENMIREEKKM
jgi:hypothetical protein